MRIAGVELPQPLADAFRSCRRHLIAVGLFSALINLLYLAPALYMLQVYDRVLTTGGTTTLLFVTLALAVSLITLAALDAIRSRLLVRASARLDAQVAPKILDLMLTRGGRDNVQAMRDFDTVRQSISSPAITALFDLPWVPIFIIVCFLLHFWIGVLAIATIVVLLLIARHHQRLTRPTVEESTRAMAASHASEQAASVQSGTLRGLGMIGAMTRRQLALRSLGIDSFARAQFTGSQYTALSRFLRLFVQSAALGLGALLAIAGQMSAGGIIAGSILLGRALQPVDGLIGGWSILTSARAALGRLAETVRQSTEAERIRTLLPDPTGKVEVEQVGVRAADGRPILLGVSFAVVPGQVIGIIGPSGSGKTTLAKVVAGAIEPDVGTVRIDGAQRADWDPDALGRFVGYLPQEPSLFEGTIKENIARFAEEQSAELDADVVVAAKLAGVHELILRMPQGYDTVLGPMGSGLSAGQSQRIALARALFRDPPILILDEPNAFLDGEGETALLEAMRAARSRGASILLVAHRRSILELADVLLVIEGGKPKMIGPAREVVARLTSPAAESAA
jgi:PrtD family type I secretion system ABC transporter